MQQTGFLSLVDEDQKALLKSNIPLYLQYLTARYLTAKSGLEQLTWILEGNLFQDYSEDVEDLTTVSFEEFVWEQLAFRSSEMFDIYSDYLLLVESFFNFPHYFNGLIANLLLYHTTELDKRNLKEPAKVESLYSSAVNLAEKELSSAMPNLANIRLSLLSFALSQMKDIFESIQTFDKSPDPGSQIPRQCSLGLTDTEENWLAHKFERLQIQFASVAPGEKRMQEALVMLADASKTKPESAVWWFSMIVERARRVLKDHSEFKDLSFANQRSLWQKNFRQSSILGLIRINVMKDAKDQFKNVIGILKSDDKAWEKKFAGLVQFDSLTTINVYQMSFEMGMLDSANVQLFTHLFREVADLCINDQTFQLLVLLSLFDTDGLPDTEDFRSVFEIRKTYLKLFERKLQAASCSFVDYSKFRTALNKVKMLSNLIETYILNSLRCMDLHQPLEETG